jgi:hypothetical protein
VGSHVLGQLVDVVRFLVLHAGVVLALGSGQILVVVLCQIQFNHNVLKSFKLLILLDYWELLSEYLEFPSDYPVFRLQGQCKPNAESSLYAEAQPVLAFSNAKLILIFGTVSVIGSGWEWMGVIGSENL